ncbi:hypothetical protein LEP1GSC049_2906 [Leptospira kirschneri serovar Cynopteri str. 3522 CT]|nr:hypothetical protein LEP1GSC049_2906 [Leptospira kirschneri serovar Cynopteri str. 3522 CT]
MKGHLYESQSLYKKQNVGTITNLNFMDRFLKCGNYHNL